LAKALEPKPLSLCNRDVISVARSHLLPGFLFG
jgi:hypothetical protein